MPTFNFLAPVAPLAGAWIETCKYMILQYIVYVAPLAGAWIETGDHRKMNTKQAGRAPRGRVD